MFLRPCSGDSASSAGNRKRGFTCTNWPDKATTRKRHFLCLPGAQGAHRYHQDPGSPCVYQWLGRRRGRVISIRCFLCLAYTCSYELVCATVSSCWLSLSELNWYLTLGCRYGKSIIHDKWSKSAQVTTVGGYDGKVGLLCPWSACWPCMPKSRGRRRCPMNPYLRSSSKGTCWRIEVTAPGASISATTPKMKCSWEIEDRIRSNRYTASGTPVGSSARSQTYGNVVWLARSRVQPRDC